MQDQIFTHENELLAMAPLSAEDDHSLFKKQQVQISVAGYIQWDFLLHDGREWHFREKIFHLKSENQLKEFQQFIRYELWSSSHAQGS